MTAAELATALSAKLVVVNAVTKVEVETVGVPGDEYQISSGEVSEKIAEQAVRDLKVHFPQLEMEARSEAGRPGEALVKAAEDLEATLIVVGNKRVQGVTWVLGSIAATVAHKAPCDVYIAHTHA